jgi:hypothetical protein
MSRIKRIKLDIKENNILNDIEKNNLEDIGCEILRFLDDYILSFTTVNKFWRKILFKFTKLFIENNILIIEKQLNFWKLNESERENLNECHSLLINNLNIKKLNRKIFTFYCMKFSDKKLPKKAINSIINCSTNSHFWINSWIQHLPILYYGVEHRGYVWENQDPKQKNDLYLLSRWIQTSWWNCDLKFHAYCLYLYKKYGIKFISIMIFILKTIDLKNITDNSEILGKNLFNRFIQYILCDILKLEKKKSYYTPYNSMPDSENYILQ